MTKWDQLQSVIVCLVLQVLIIIDLDQHIKVNVLKCPKGTYGKNTGQKNIQACIQCKVNFYNDKEGQSACKACPSGMHTKKPGSVYISECSSPKGSAQVEAQLKNIENKITNDLDGFAKKAKENEKKLQDAMKKFEAEKNSKCFYAFKLKNFV